MQESIVQFGPNDGLMGILTTPEASARIEGAPTAVIINAGIVHRIGPFRLHVNIARQLAEAGFSTLRLDLSGLGDSQSRTEKLNGENRAVLDAKAAMDHLQASGQSENFVLIGLCSGAFNAHQVAIADPRVTGGVFLDGIVFRTTGYFWRHTVGRLLRPRFYRNALKRRVEPRKNPWPNEDAGTELAEGEFFFADDLDQAGVTREIRDFLDRGMRMLFVYTDGYDDVCGAKQFREMYGIRPSEQLQVKYHDQSEHTFPIVEHRDQVCQQIVDWYQGQFAVASMV